MDEFTQRLTACHKRIHSICAQVGRDPSTVRLLAVSKTHPPESIRRLHALGQWEFGENYAQELAEKHQSLSDLALTFVFIGSLQSNKIPLIVRHAAEIQSVASLRHAQLIAREARRLGKTPYPVYILVNAGDEASKSGVSMAEVLPLAAAMTTMCPELALQGVMAIPPPLPQSRSTEQGHTIAVPHLYAHLRTLADKVGLGRLSLGMSDDLEEALAAGSDCVRIGTALMGPRVKRD